MGNVLLTNRRKKEPLEGMNLCFLQLFLGPELLTPLRKICRWVVSESSTKTAAQETSVSKECLLIRSENSAIT